VRTMLRPAVVLAALFLMLAGCNRKASGKGSRSERAKPQTAQAATQTISQGTSPAASWTIGPSRWQELDLGVLVARVLGVRVVQAASGQTPTVALHVPELDAGFHLLYELKPEEARKQFEAWQKSHPEDPLGSASMAASYLFEECYRQGILTSEIFLDNKRFFGTIPLKTDPKLRAVFFAADKQAQDLAELRLKTNPDDTNALFAMTLSVGMEADYASLIDKHQLDSLKMIGEADKYAKKLLVIAPDAADAYLTLGTANYVIGSLPRLKRFILGLAGIHGNKKAGIQQLEIAADHGHYLRPFAKILLALAALREKKPAVARAQLGQLVAEFPGNPLFANELAKLKGSPTAAVPLKHLSQQWDKPKLCLNCLAQPKEQTQSIFAARHTLLAAPWTPLIQVAASVRSSPVGG